MIQFDTQHYTEVAKNVIKMKIDEIIKKEIDKHIESMKENITKEIMDMLPRIETFVTESMTMYGAGSRMEVLIKMEER